MVKKTLIWYHEDKCNVCFVCVAASFRSYQLHMDASIWRWAAISFSQIEAYRSSQLRSYGASCIQLVAFLLHRSVHMYTHIISSKIPSFFRARNSWGGGCCAVGLLPPDSPGFGSGPRVLTCGGPKDLPKKKLPMLLMCNYGLIDWNRKEVIVYLN